MAGREVGSEIHRLVHEMERVDCALATHLRAVHDDVKGSGRSGSGALPLTYARAQIKSWCNAHRGMYDPEVLSSTMMAVDTMSRRDLAALLRGLAAQLKANRKRRPAA
jgi:hypothetical protein